MNRVTLIASLALVMALVGCGETPLPDPAPLITAVGTPSGSPVTQNITAAGGNLSAAGITVNVPAGAFTGANLTLQPITDTVNGSGQGIEISSDAAWDKYLTVTFPIETTDTNPKGLGLAVQQADGSWRALEPVKVDTVAGTVTAGLPALTEAVAATGLRTQAALNLKRVIKFERFYMNPDTATVKVKGTQGFVPYAQVLEKSNDSSTQCKQKIRVAAGIDDDLAPLTPICWRPVTNKYPFTNNKNGYSREWKVNSQPDGNSTVGTIKASGASGATFTAPDKRPSEGTVSVQFTSVNDLTQDNVFIDAYVTITDDTFGQIKITIRGSRSDTYSDAHSSGSESSAVDIVYSLNLKEAQFFGGAFGLPPGASYSLIPQVSGTVMHTSDRTSTGPCDPCQPSKGTYTQVDHYTGKSTASVAADPPVVIVFAPNPRTGTVSLASALFGIALSGTAQGSSVITGCSPSNQSYTDPPLGGIPSIDDIDLTLSDDPAKPSRLKGTVTQTKEISTGGESFNGAGAFPVTITIEYDLPWEPASIGAARLPPPAPQPVPQKVPVPPALPKQDAVVKPQC